MCKVDGIGGVLNAYRWIVWQGEARDSSDEEWEAAYAAMDPGYQSGWENRRREVNGVGDNLLRDVFVAADEVHGDAMSAMDWNTQEEEGGAPIAAGAEGEGASPCTEGSVHLLDTLDTAVEGEHPIRGVNSWNNSTLFCSAHCNRRCECQFT